MLQNSKAFLPIIQIGNASPASDARFRNVSAVIVKVTHRCNLDCSYCYEHITKSGDMPLDTFRSLVDRITANSNSGKITFIFHGGEPTLLDNDWFREAINYCRRSAESNSKQIFFSIQSNALGLNDSKIRMLHELGIRLSISLDGPRDVPHPMRDRGGLALKKLKMAQASGLDVGVLMTINHMNFSHFSTICPWLDSQVGVRTFKANVVASVGQGSGLPDLQPEQIFRAYYDILEYMIETKGKAVVEDNLRLELNRFFASDLERSLMSASLCRDRHCGAGDKVVGITPEGKLLPCGRFQWDDREYFLGELDNDYREETLESFKESVERFHSLVPESWLDCDTCDAKKVCSFGCQAFIVRSSKKANLDCAPTKMRFAYYEQNRTRLEPVIGAIRSQLLSYNGSNPSSNSYNDYSDHYNDFSYNDFSK